MSDLLTLIVITSLLTLVALIACWLPARRAAKVDPLATNSIHERRDVMKSKTMMFALALIATTFAFANGQKSNPLSGTSWRLVKFQGPDERVFTPDDKSKYTISFGRSGGVIARIDCNNARSTWRITASGQLHFGSWSRTSAKCGAGSLHDQIVREGAAVRNFSIKDGHLFLSGMEGGGYYELEPLP